MAQLFNFWDESGFRADAVQGRTWGVKGETPIVAVPCKRQSVSVASAVNAKGAFWFATYKGGMSADLFVAMLKQIMRVAASRCSWGSTVCQLTRQSS